MTERIRRLLAVVAVLSAGALLGTISPIPSAAASELSPLQVTPNEIVDSTEFSLAFTEPQFCPGDSNKGYLWQTFITPATADPSTLTYAVGLPQGPTFTSALRDATGSWVRNENPGLTDGLVVPPRAMSFEGRAFDGLTSGEYLLGVACTKQGSDDVTRTVRAWFTQVSVTRTQSGSKRTLRVSAPTAPAAATGPSGAASPGEVTESSGTPPDSALPAASTDPSTSETTGSGTVATGDSVSSDTTAVALTAPHHDSGGSWWWLLWVLLAVVAVRGTYLFLTRRAKGSAT